MLVERSRNPLVRATPSRRSTVRPAAAGLLAAALCFALPLKAQTLQELYEAARSYDAAYLGARAQT